MGKKYSPSEKALRESLPKTVSEMYPLPWRALNLFVLSADGERIAEIGNPGNIGILDKLDAETAAFIVRACNSHYDLVEALEKLVREADEGNPFCSIGHLIEHVVPQARAALAKAKGEA